MLGAIVQEIFYFVPQNLEFIKQHQFSNGSCFVEKFRSFCQKSFFFCSVERVGLNYSNKNYDSLRT